MLAEENPALLAEALHEFANSLSDEQVIEVLKHLHSDETLTPHHSTLANLLIQRWSQHAPSEAAGWAASLPDNPFGRRAFRAISIAWAEKDLDSALTWIAQLPESGNKSVASLSLAVEAARQRKAVTAIELVAGLPAGAERDIVLKYSALQWSATDRESAVQWAARVPDTELRDEMLGALATQWGIQHPHGAAEFVATLPDGKRRDAAVVQIVRCWASASPAEAVAWVEQFPESPLRGSAMGSLVEVLGRNDLIAAGNWLNDLVWSPSRDRAVSVYASVLAGRYPAAAIQWAESIQNPAMRSKLIEQFQHGDSQLR